MDRKHLTPRQWEILTLLAESCPNKEIALLLGITTGSVKRRITEIYRVIQVDNRVSAARWMWEQQERLRAEGRTPQNQWTMDRRVRGRGTNPG